MADNNINDLDASLEFFNTPEYQKRMEELKKREIREKEFEKLGFDISMGRYPSSNEKTTSSVEVAHNLTNKSLGRNKKTRCLGKLDYNKSTFNNNNKNKQKVLALLGAALIVISLGVGIYHTSERNEKEEAIQNEYNQSMDVLRSKAIFNLISNGLAEMDDNNLVIKENSIYGYNELGISNTMDVYVYRSLLPEEEFNKFIQGVSYEENGFVRNYVDMEQFLRINGMLDRGAPSTTVFDNMMKQDVLDITADVLDEYKNSDSILTYGEMLEVLKQREDNKGMGGI